MQAGISITRGADLSPLMDDLANTLVRNTFWFPCQSMMDVMRQHIHHYRDQGLCFSAKCNPWIEGTVKGQVSNAHKDKNLKEKKKKVCLPSFLEMICLQRLFQSSAQSLSQIPPCFQDFCDSLCHRVCTLRKEEASAPSRCIHSTWVPSYVCAGQLNFRSVFLLLRELSRKQTNKNRQIKERNHYIIMLDGTKEEKGNSGYLSLWIWQDLVVGRNWKSKPKFIFRKMKT